MATYQEIFDLRSNDAFKNKIAVAVLKKAQAYIDAVTPTADQLKWSGKAIQNPTAEAEKLVNYVLAANSGATTSQILSASDAAIQTNVNKAVDAMVGGGII